jgi:hypothetical protein
MLIKFVKFCWSIWYFILCWTFLPVFMFLFRRSEWQARPFDFARAMLNDPDIVKALTDAGMAAMLLQLQQQVDTLAANAPRGPSRKPPTEEDMEWGMFIQNYGENPQPDMVPEYFRYVLRGGTTGSTELPTAAAVIALVHSRPHWADEWRQEFPELFKKAEQWMHADPNRAGWNDFYMVQWFILRDDEIVKVLKARAEIPGIVGDTCKWMLNSVSQQIPAFAEALERVGYEFPESNVGRMLPLETPPPGLPYQCPACGILLAPAPPASQPKESS